MPDNRSLDALVRMFSTLTSKYPEFNPGWSQEAQASWYAGWDRLADKALLILAKVERNEVTPPTPDQPGPGQVAEERKKVGE